MTGSAQSGLRNKKEAERRQAHLFQWPRATGAARAQRSALACRRSTTALAAASERHSSAPDTRFLGPGVIRCYLHLACPSPATSIADRSSCRPGVIPRSSPGAGLTSPHPREPLSPRQHVVTGWRPFTEARFGLGNLNRDN